MALKHSSHLWISTLCNWKHNSNEMFEGVNSAHPTTSTADDTHNADCLGWKNWSGFAKFSSTKKLIFYSWKVAEQERSRTATKTHLRVECSVHKPLYQIHEILRKKSFSSAKIFIHSKNKHSSSNIYRMWGFFFSCSPRNSSAVSAVSTKHTKPPFKCFKRFSEFPCGWLRGEERTWKCYWRLNFDKCSVYLTTRHENAVRVLVELVSSASIGKVSASTKAKFPQRMWFNLFNLRDKRFLFMSWVLQRLDVDEVSSSEASKGFYSDGKISLALENIHFLIKLI